ncbi:DUF6090 family protein [Tamlana flava]|uniref:DUF6090 family protein n=1 Tax=Tamlana flava TaxID=3158572 RepID=UPI00351AF219
MMKLFRNIRKKLLNQSKITKYLKYAIGEIILVVIGILIALQINNWNETRKAKTRSVQYHTRLIEDLNRTITTSQNLNETAHHVLSSIKLTIDLLNSKKLPTEEEQKEIDYTIIWLSRFNYQFSEMATFDEMKSNGELSLIYNLDTRNKLVNFHEYSISVDAIFDRLGASIINSNTFSKHILTSVDPETLDITNHYNFMEMADDKEFINELSRFSVHWRGNAWFTKQIVRRATDLKESVQTDLDELI